MHSLKPLARVTSLTLMMMFVLNMIVYAQEPGEVIADMGFQVNLDGFSFENYEDGHNLTAVEMQRLFGDEVCKSASAGETAGCDLTAPAKMWMESVNRVMSGGHCEGLATLSMLFFTGDEDVNEFGGGETYDLKLDDNDPLQREIAFWWATQITNPTADSVIYNLPSKIVSNLVESINGDGEIFTLGLYAPDGSGGHSVLPYAVTDQGNDVNWVFVYDSNWPDKELYVEVDTKAETWRYDMGGGIVYEGDAETRSLSLSPITPRLDFQDCPFCGDVNYESNEGYTTVSLDTVGARMSVIDKYGNITGYNKDKGKWVNKIPGAKLTWPRNIFLGGVPAPRLDLPNSSPYKITATEGPDTPPFEGATFTVIRSGSVTTITDPDLSSNEETLTIDGDSIQYQPGDGDETLVFEQSITSEGNDYHFVVEPQSSLDEGETLDVSFDAESGDIQVGGSEDNTYNVSVDRIDEEGNESSFSIEGLEVPEGADANLNAGEWQEGDQLTGEIVGEDGSEIAPIDEPDTGEGISTDTSNSETGSEVGGDDGSTDNGSGEGETDTGSNDGSDTGGSDTGSGD